MVKYGSIVENGNQFRITLDTLIDSRMLIQANSGGGKSYAVRKLLESTHGEVQQIVIDPEGEFATLREKFDYVVASAQGGDALAHPKTAKLLAERLLETGVSAILDIYELKPHERTAFVRVFLDTMVNAPKHLWHPCLVVLDEAHVYAPETDKSEAHGAVADMATRGRKRGFCLIAATQRISKLSKDVAAELNNKLIGRATLDVDVKRAAAELGIPVGDAMKQLRSPPMEAGQFYAFGPATNVAGPTLMMVGEVVTRHPKRGERATATPKPTQAILDVLPKLADLPREAEHEQRTVDDLKRELAKTRRDLSLVKNAKAGTSDDELREAVKNAEARGYVRGIDDAERSAMSAIQSQAGALIQSAMNLLKAGKPAGAHRIPAPPPARVKLTTMAYERESSDGVSRPQQKILDAIAWLRDKGIDPAPKNSVAAVAGCSPTSGGYFNNLGSLKSAGLIDYPQPGFACLTEAGSNAANAPENDGIELHDKWLEIVSEPQAKILRKLIEAHPEPLEKNSLAEQIGVSPTSGGYFNNLGSLRTLGAIDYPQKGFAALTKHVMP